MNFLAHLYLSSNNDDQLIGNFIGDYVKGVGYQKYKEAIAQGILLHRQIDFFSDHHPLHRQVSNLFKPLYFRYAGVITDVVFDHYLAKNWDLFHVNSLDLFANHCYQILSQNAEILPDRVQQFLPKLIANNRLQSYASLEQTIEALDIMSIHTSLPNNSSQLYPLLVENDALIENDFLPFFNELRQFVASHTMPLGYAKND